MSVLRRNLFNRIWNRPDFLDRAETNSICLAQGAVDGPCLSHAHLGATDERGNVGGISIAVANEAFARFGFINRGLECPSLYRRIRESRCWPHVDARAPIPAGQSQ